MTSRPDLDRPIYEPLSKDELSKRREEARRPSTTRRIGNTALTVIGAGVMSAGFLYGANKQFGNQEASDRQYKQQAMEHVVSIQNDPAIDPGSKQRIATELGPPPTLPDKLEP